MDIRIPNDEIEDTDELFRQLKEMEDVRTDCFVELCNEEEIEFGFLANGEPGLSNIWPVVKLNPTPPSRKIANLCHRAVRKVGSMNI